MRSHSLIEVRAALALVPSLVRASQKRLEILPSYGLPQAIRVGPAAAPALHGAAKTARVAASVLNAFVDLPRRSPQALPAHATLLCGAPIAVKANICVGGELVAGAASRMLAGYVPVHTATVVERLQSAGGVVVGATNMDEFGMGSSTNASVHGPSYNPASPPAAFLRANAGADPAAIERALARPEWVSAWLSPGGSSGGAAVAVATGGAVAGVGSDTGGSVRLPAALCGLVGFKPTYGAIPRWGLIAYASSLDTIGLITRTVADAAVLFDVVRSPDDRDETAALAETAAREMQLAAANAFASHLAASTGSAHPHPHDAARDHLSEDQDARAAPAPTDPRSTDHMTLPSHERPTVGDRHRTYRPDRADLLQCGHDYPHRRWRRALEGREMGAYPPSRSDLIGR